MNTKSTAKLLVPPSFRWSGRQALSELRAAVAQQEQRPLPYKEFGKITGVSKTTAYRWLEEIEHPIITGLFACLERLPVGLRHDFIDSRCRDFPDFDHPDLAHSPSQIGKLNDLVQKRRGLTILTGSGRGFVFHAFGHACRRIYCPDDLIGLDLNRPDHCVPLESCMYFESSELRVIRQAVLSVWPKVLTASAQTVLLNDVWLLQELRDDITGLAAQKHVVLACVGTPNLKRLIQRVSTPIHLVTAFDSKRVSGGIRVTSRQLRSAKSSEITQKPK